MNIRTVLRSVTAFPAYPLLIAVLPVVRFYEANFRSFFPRDFVRIGLAYLILAGLLLFVARRLWHGRHRGALVTAPVMALLFSGNDLGGIPCAAMLAGTVVLGIYLMVRRPDPSRLTPPLNATFMVLLVLPVLHAWWADRSLIPPVPTDLFTQPLPTSMAPDRIKPDIWFLLVDGLGAPSLVEREFGLNPAQYSGQLRQRGFQVPDLSHSNYQQTGLSLSSTWNVAHLPVLLAVPDTSSHDRRPLYNLIGDSRVTRALHTLGYRIIDVPSSYPMTRLKKADARREPLLAPNMVEYSILAKSLLPVAQPLLGHGPADFSFALRRRSLNDIFGHLPDARSAAPSDQPALVFAHILAPHPPFVFNADGSARRSDSTFGFFDGSHWLDRHGWAAGHYRRKYLAQATYVMRRLGETVDRILNQAQRPTIIIVQGDHGPGSGLDWERPRHTDHHERSAILNGWYLPPDLQTDLPANMTSLDTFPFLFETAFGIHLETPPPTYLISRWSRPYIFFEIRRATRESDR